MELARDGRDTAIRGKRFRRERNVLHPAVFVSRSGFANCRRICDEFRQVVTRTGTDSTDIRDPEEETCLTTRSNSPSNPSVIHRNHGISCIQLLSDPVAPSWTIYVAQQSRRLPQVKDSTKPSARLTETIGYVPHQAALRNTPSNGTPDSAILPRDRAQTEPSAPFSRSSYSNPFNTTFSDVLAGIAHCPARINWRDREQIRMRHATSTGSLLRKTI